jgi:hypothetical protein
MADTGRDRCAAVGDKADARRGDANGSSRDVVNMAEEEKEDDEEAELGRGMAAVRDGDKTGVVIKFVVAVCGRSRMDGVDNAADADWGECAVRGRCGRLGVAATGEPAPCWPSAWAAGAKR